MYKLGLNDVFIVSEIIDLMDIKIDLEELSQEAKSKPDIQAYVGGQMAMLFIRNLHKAKEPVVKWVAQIKGVSEDEVMELGFKELVETFKEVFTGEDLIDFFEWLSKTEAN